MKPQGGLVVVVQVRLQRLQPQQLHQQQEQWVWRTFWINHMQPFSPLVAIAAGRFLSAHVTSCATERNWSLFGNIFSKTRNRLHLEKAQKLAFIRANSSLGQAGGLDEEIRLSLIDLIEGGEEEEEEM